MLAASSADAPVGEPAPKLSRRRKAVAEALGRLEAAAGLAGRRLGPALALLEEGEQRLARLAMGLGKVKHHVLVKGVTIETEEQAQVRLV